MPGIKTNERPGTRAVLRHSSIPAQKARQVLDLIRGEDADRAAEILRATSREAAVAISKVLASAVANAVHNDGLDAEDLYVSACFADESTTLKRWRPRARGRATRIRKRSCHVTVIVSRMDDERLARRRLERDANQARRSRRVTESRRRADLSGRLTRRRVAHAEAEEARQLADAEEEIEELDDVLTEDEELEFEEDLAADDEADEATESDENAENAEDAGADEDEDPEDGGADDDDEETNS
ncbi:MAG: 50S ribosomal protein L22 [Acidimicrobiales bacterium]